MGAGFDVRVPALRDGARWLEADAGDVGDGGTAAASAAGAAGGAVNGGALAEASAELAQVLGERSAQMRDVTATAGATLTGNADTYDGTDRGAAALLGSTSFDP